MIRSTILPAVRGEFVKWINSEEFVVSMNGVEIVAHRNHWIGDFPPYKPQKDDEASVTSDV